MTLNERVAGEPRYSHSMGLRMSAKLMARVRAVAESRELRVSELVRDAIVEKLARIEAEPEGR